MVEAEDVMEGSIGWMLTHIYSDDEEKALFWLGNRNINLGGSSPLTLINSGRSEKVVAYLESVIK